MKAIKFIFVLFVVIVTTPGGWAGIEPKSPEQIVAEANNKFALALYARLRAEQGNLFFSPYSISTALAMTYGGARGQTEMQMARVLGFTAATARSGSKAKKEQVESAAKAWDQQRLHHEFGKVIKDLNAGGKKGGYELTVANALWGQKGYGFLKEFLQLIETNYGGKFREVDFVRAAEAARNTINAWVEKETKNKIKDLIGPGVLNSMTRLVLTNAIYFKGNWASQFEKDKTRDDLFTLIDGKNIKVPMMNQTARFGYMELDDFQGLELPYVDDELSMIILLPKEMDGLGEFEKTLMAEDLSDWLGKLRKRRTIVSIPKFKMTSRFSLTGVLASMGMTDAFVPGVADFSGMNSGKDLFISAVIHKAYVDVNEEGTEAAAATGVAVGITSVGPRIPVFRADHPFVFLIRDNNSGSILFVGRVMNPES